MVCSKIIGFPHKVILSAMRGYCRYARIAHDVKDPLAKHGIEVDASMINSGVHRFGHEKSEMLLHAQSHAAQDWDGRNPFCLKGLRTGHLTGNRTGGQLCPRHWCNRTPQHHPVRRSASGLATFAERAAWSCSSNIRNLPPTTLQYPAFSYSCPSRVPSWDRNAGMAQLLLSVVFAHHQADQSQ